MGLYLDPDNNIYVADSLDQEIRFINVTTPLVSTVAGNGTQGFSGDGGVATSAQLNLPGSVFLDSAQNLVISDTGNQRVRVVTAGNISTFAGGGSGGDGGPSASATLADPYNVAEDGSGNVYVADTENSTVAARISAGNTRLRLMRSTQPMPRVSSGMSLSLNPW